MSQQLHGSRRLPHAALGLAWISPWLAGLALFLLLPVGMSIYYSLTDYPVLEPPVFIGLENYSRLVHDGVFGRVLLNTIIYAAVSVPVGSVLALAIAVLLNQKVHGLSFFRAAVFLPTLVPIVASAMIWLWLFNGELGLINQFLALIGLTGPNWLQDTFWAMPALIVMSFWSVGGAVVIYLAALQGVPRELYEAADIDGVRSFGRFTHVTLPMISPVVLYNVILAIIATWQVFAVPYIMTRGGPGRATYFYTMYLYDQAFFFGNMGYASAMAWIQTLIVFALTLLTLWVSRRFVYYRAA